MRSKSTTGSTSGASARRAPAPPAGAKPLQPPTRDAVDARDPKTSAPLDQALLDEALKETFPASDPISPSAAAAEGPPEPVPEPAPPSDEPIPFPTAESMGAAKSGGAGKRD